MKTQLREMMNLVEELNRTYYHGSMHKLPVGTILTPREDYEEKWKNTDFYSVLELYRPIDMIAHKNGVFMCDNPDDIDLAGGGTEWLFTVQPLGKTQRHDLNWGSEISCLISDGHDIDDDEIEEATHNYWAGIPHTDENVWEYITQSAKILEVEEY